MYASTSLFWVLPPVIQLMAKKTVKRVEFGREGYLYLLTNFSSVPVFDAVVSSEWQASWDLINLVIPSVKVALKTWMGNILPGDAELQTQWIFNSINHSTKGLARGGLSAHVSSQVFNLLKGMRPGLEASHLQSLFTLLDMRGSDVKLDTGTVVEGGRHLVPYPASAWDWKSIQSYRWQTPQHINVFELLAFFQLY